MVYETVHILTGFHADLIVEEVVIVEIKALERIAPVHKKQLLTYLKLADKRLGCSLTSTSRSSKTASPVSSTDCKNDLTPSRQGRKDKPCPARRKTIPELSCPAGATF